MTYGQAMKKVLALLDDNNPGAATKEKIRGYLSEGQKEVALHYPIWRECEYAAGEDKTLPYDCYRPAFVLVDGQRFAYAPDAMMPDTACTLEYEAYPMELPYNIQETYELDLPDEAMLTVVYYAVAMLNAMEYDQRPFQNFYSLYQGKLQNLESKKPVGTVVIKCISP